MGLSGLWRYFNQETEFRAVKTESYDGEEEDNESEKLLRKRGIARKSVHPTACICLTVANVVILSITIFVVFIATGNLSRNEKNAILRPISWWCSCPLI